MTAHKVLVPFDAREGLTTAVAARRACRSERRMREWCELHGLGRRVGSGDWVVSKVALRMFLDGDEAALGAYRSGDRSSALVASYFAREGLTCLLQQWREEKSAIAAITATTATPT